MKNKHNKKRNTAFLYEVIVREITNSILEKDQNKKDYLKMLFLIIHYQIKDKNDLFKVMIHMPMFM